MKRIKLFSFGLVLSMVAAFGAAGAVNAEWSPNFKASEENVTLTRDQTHEGSLYATGNQITIDGTVTGSLYCAGNVITINGSVEGDVLCAGQKVTINGTVGQDARVAGQFVQIDGEVNGSLTAFAQDVRLEKDATVAQDVNGAAQQVTLNGVVGRDVAIGAQILALNNEVKGSVDSAVEQLQLGDSASVLGNLNYSSQREASFDEAKVVGTVSFNEVEDRRGKRGMIFGAFKLLFVVSLALSALVLVLIMPRFLQRSSELFSGQIGTTILAGFAVVFGGPIVFGLLLFSILLAPIGLALLFGWLVVIFLSGIFFAYWVGSELLRSQQNIVVRMLGGMAVVLVLYLIPVINVFTMFAALVVGSGIIVTTLTKGYRRPAYSIEEPAVAPKPAKKSK